MPWHPSSRQVHGKGLWLPTRRPKLFLFLLFWRYKRYRHVLSPSYLEQGCNLRTTSLALNPGSHKRGERRNQDELNSHLEYPPMLSFSGLNISCGWGNGSGCKGACDHLSSIPGTYTVRKENKLLAVVLQPPPVYHDTHMCLNTHVHMFFFSTFI